jgi:hypothetical protein
MQQIRLWHSETETGPYVYIVVGQDLHVYMRVSYVLNLKINYCQPNTL